LVPSGARAGRAFRMRVLKESARSEPEKAISVVMGFYDTGVGVEQ